MTIHADHPFLEPEQSRDPVRRLRGRLGSAVSLWTSGEAADRCGLTVSSVLVVAGEPGRVLAAVDPESDLVATVLERRTAVVTLLQWRHRALADAFGGVAPAPGGAFRLTDWEQTAWGPRPADASTWAGVRLVGEPREVGWSLLLEAAVETVEVGGEDDALVYRRGRYIRAGERA